ncbi:MAG: LysR family transcriptional regulator [Actinomycetes bacterium]
MLGPSARLANLDLNLLVALRELVRERNVTRAAERLGVTQPAASAALSRLRRHFGDELLVRGKGGYALTPLGEQLAEQVEAVCDAAEHLFATTTGFDPATSQREFTLVMADYTIAVMGERLSQLVYEAAPQASLHVRLVRESMSTEYAESIRFIDGVVAPPLGRSRPASVRSAELFRDRWVCVVSNENRALGPGPLTVDDLARLTWVAPFHRDPGHTSAVPITRQLTRFGIQPHIGVRVESYLAVPHFVAGTDRIALMQERLAARFAGRMDLRVLECPGEPEPIVEALWWHEHYQDEPAHMWLRERVAEAAPPAHLPAPPPAQSLP